MPDLKQTDRSMFWICASSYLDSSYFTLPANSIKIQQIYCHSFAKDMLYLRPRLVRLVRGPHTRRLIRCWLRLTAAAAVGRTGEEKRRVQNE